MKTKLNLIIAVLMTALAVRAEDKNLRATIGTMLGKGFVIEVKVNGVLIPGFDIENGKSVAFQLFHRNYPMEAPVADEFKFATCLNEGTNTLDVTYKQVESTSHQNLRIYVNAIGYSKELIKGTVKADQKEGKLSGVFELHAKEPDGFVTAQMK